jgi:hypothetical protein
MNGREELIMTSRNTGAFIDGKCPGCHSRIVGVMPQRCFKCGYDFTSSIQDQNPDFTPDPDYKSVVADAVPFEEGVYRDLKMSEKIGPHYADPFEAAANVLNQEMDRQRDLGNELQKQLDVIVNSSIDILAERGHPDWDADFDDEVLLFQTIIGETIVETFRTVNQNASIGQISAKRMSWGGTRPGAKIIIDVRVNFPHERIICETRREIVKQLNYDVDSTAEEM